MADEGAWASTSYSNVQDGGSDGGSSRRRRKCVMGLVGLLLVGGIATGVALVVKKHNDDDNKKTEIADSPDSADHGFESYQCGAENMCIKANESGVESFDSSDCDDKCGVIKKYKCGPSGTCDQVEEGCDGDDDQCYTADGCDGACDEPEPMRYKCDGGNCLPAEGCRGHGCYTESECGGTCHGHRDTWDCDGGKCKPYTGPSTGFGNYTSLTCDGECHAVGGKKYSCGTGRQSGQCIENNVDGVYSEANCEQECQAPQMYKCNKKRKQCVEKDPENGGTMTFDECDSTCNASLTSAKVETSQCGTTCGGCKAPCTNNPSSTCTNCGHSPCSDTDGYCWSCAGSDNKCYPYDCGDHCSTGPCLQTGLGVQTATKIQQGEGSGAFEPAVRTMGAKIPSVKVSAPQNALGKAQDYRCCDSGGSCGTCSGSGTCCSTDSSPCCPFPNANCCPGEDGCCPSGTVCCPNNKCCPAGYSCASGDKCSKLVDGKMHVVDGYQKGGKNSITTNATALRPRTPSTPSKAAALSKASKSTTCQCCGMSDCATCFMPPGIMTYTVHPGQEKVFSCSAAAAAHTATAFSYNAKGRSDGYWEMRVGFASSPAECTWDSANFYFRCVSLSSIRMSLQHRPLQVALRCCFCGGTDREPLGSPLQPNKAFALEDDPLAIPDNWQSECAPTLATCTSALTLNTRLRMLLTQVVISMGV
jgi:hypothetical protein